MATIMEADIRKLDLNLLKALDALLTERSVTRAAERLALTQPAVSGMLTRLREQFDDPLFVRARHGIIPTARAEALAVPVREVLHSIEQMLQPQQFEPATAHLTLSIAATDYAQCAILVPYLAVLRQQAPGVRVVIRPVDQESLQPAMERGELDMALVTPSSTPQGLHARRLFDEEYVCVMRAGHPDAAPGKALPLARFCALEHALVSLGGEPFSGVTDEALAQAGTARRVVLSVSSFLVLPEILAITDLVAVVPARLARQRSGIICMQPPLPIPGFTKVLAWHARTQHDAGHRWLRELLYQVCHQQTE